MPNKDGTGPRGRGAGQGGRRGTGRARGGGGRSGAGFGGNCVCPNCGLKISHTPGQPCTKQICPDCSTKMIRE